MVCNGLDYGEVEQAVVLLLTLTSWLRIRLVHCRSVYHSAVFTSVALLNSFAFSCLVLVRCYAWNDHLE